MMPSNDNLDDEAYWNKEWTAANEAMAVKFAAERPQRLAAFRVTLQSMPPHKACDTVDRLHTATELLTEAALLIESLQDQRDKAIAAADGGDRLTTHFRMWLTPDTDLKRWHDETVDLLRTVCVPFAEVI